MHVYGGGAYPAYLIDAETLREELLSEEDTREWLEEVPDDPHAVSFWRMLGELDRALAAGRGRLAEQDEGSDSWAAAALRLAHVHHWREEYEEAHRLFDAAEAVFRGSAGADDEGPGARMVALVRQHRAKALLDEGRPAQAREEAAAALALRERLGEDAGLVASSRQTLDRIERECR